ncbi:unnamed protein product [Ascophyllum nodosum]
MIAVKSRKQRGTEDCGTMPSFGGVNTRTAEYCAQHARIKCGVDGCSEKEVGPHNSGKGTTVNSNVIPSDGKRPGVYPPPIRASPPSGCTRGSRKRARHPETPSTASKRAVARESSGRAGTLPGIDGQKPPVKRDSSVKAEVQLSL